MKLDLEKWKEFHLDKLFNITSGKYYYVEEYDEGVTAYVSAANTNNGIQKRINLIPDFKGNCIITGKVGCTAFYQFEDFCATSDVNIFYPKHFKMTPALGLFLVTVINFSENYKWSYGRQCRIGDSKKIIIKLPIQNKNNTPIIDTKKIYSTEGFIPDWDFMKKYIKEMNCNPLTTKNSGGGGYKSLIFGKNRWKEFKIGTLFNKIYKSKSYNFDELDEVEYNEKNSIPYITRTNINNGCKCFVRDTENLIKEKSNAIVIGDTTSTCFYQKEDFITGEHIIILRNDKWLNIFTGLFIKTVIEQEKFRYSYGRAFVINKIKETKIRLPVDTKGNPNWQLIESYMSSLPYSDKI